MDTTDRPKRMWARRIGWLVTIWVVSVLAIGAVAYLLRWVLKP